MDKDDDGKVSKDEFRGPAPLFDRLDADKDGFVTKEETAAMAERVRELSAKRFQAMDKDDDGKVSPEEFGGRRQAFDRLDADKDGFLTGGELRARRPAQGKARTQALGEPGNEDRAVGRGEEGGILGEAQGRGGGQGPGEGQVLERRVRDSPEKPPGGALPMADTCRTGIDGQGRPSHPFEHASP